jgi:6-phosphogluconolactonase (cycloisomerase 2 family)
MKTLSLYLIVIIALTSALLAQEIPNGDGDLLWERSLGGRFVNDAKFHPINGNIIAAVNHEIWEIDPKDGHTIRVLYAGTSSEEKYHFHSIDITSDGSTILTDDGDSILVWDYEKGVVKQTFHNGETIAWQGLGGIYPDNNRVVYFSYNTEQQVRKLNIYDISTNSIIKSISTYPKSADKVKLSKDGRYLAIGFRYRPVNDMIYTMELWDAETLTKIKEFGEVSGGDFEDIQFSNDNNYIGYMANHKLYLVKKRLQCCSNL